MNIVIIGGSRIVLIGSTSGIRRDRGGIYGISKWALRSYAYALREECKAKIARKMNVKSLDTFVADYQSVQ